MANRLSTSIPGVPGVNFREDYEPGDSVDPRTLINRDGKLWLAKRATDKTPGTSGSDEDWAEFIDFTAAGEATEVAEAARQVAIQAQAASSAAVSTAQSAANQVASRANKDGSNLVNSRTAWRQAIVGREPDYTADVLLYGTTPASICAAYKVARGGKTAFIVGGHRDYRLGGMMSGGLGGTDADDVSVYGGLAREALRRIVVANGRSPAAKNFEPRFAEQVFEAMVAEFSDLITVVYTQGVASVVKEAGRITGFQTVDGKRFAGKIVIDGSYEQDLLYRALRAPFVTYGREARGVGDSINGYRASDSGQGGNDHNWIVTADNISPFVVAGDPTSGLLPRVNAKPQLDYGLADDRLQAYCFRVNMTTTAARRVALPSTPPDGYTAADYELLFRRCQALTDLGYTYVSSPSAPGEYWEGNGAFFIINQLGNGALDVNSGGPFSLDMWGGNYGYATASYAQREVIRQAHVRYTKGLFYALQYAPDARVPAGLRAAIQEYGLLNDHYVDPVAKAIAAGRPDIVDEPYWPHQFYVRENFRMVSDFRLIGSDLAAADGTAPRSTNIIAITNYSMDSHHTQMYADLVAGTYKVRNEGCFFVAAGGANGIGLIPMEALIPPRAAATNFLTLCGPSASHMAFQAIRMEMTFMAIGEAAGAMALVALDGVTQTAVQDLDYADVRSALLASPDPTPPTIPQVN